MLKFNNKFINKKYLIMRNYDFVRYNGKSNCTLKNV